MARPTSRGRDTSEIAPWAAGGLFVAGAAILGHALRAYARGPSSRRRPLLVGGVDLSNIDTSQPFGVNFSVPPSASLAVKQAALSQLSYAFAEFRKWQAGWLYRPEADVSTGRFFLYVVPLR
jgi:hypothetical protein